MARGSTACSRRPDDHATTPSSTTTTTVQTANCSSTSCPSAAAATTTTTTTNTTTTPTNGHKPLSTANASNTIVTTTTTDAATTHPSTTHTASQRRPRTSKDQVLAKRNAIADIVSQLIRYVDAQEQEQHQHETQQADNADTAVAKANKKKGTPLSVTQIKTAAAKRHGLKDYPKQVDILAAVPSSYRSRLAPYLKAKPVRTASGIAVVAVMSKPHRCPHIATTGNICVYCPGGPDSDFEYSTQSYTGHEPTSMRAIRARYDPYVQVRSRVDQLQRLGHDVEKVEFIVMGGTFMSLDEGYRDYFMRNLHDALSGHCSRSVDEAVTYSEQATTKCVALTIESRPDHSTPRHLSSMLRYGCTRLEIGVQSVYEDIARDTNRGHSVQAVCDCFRLAKDAGFKVVAHMMPDLPNMGYERDLESFRELFENPDFRPDGLKIYPTLVIRGTGLYELWKNGLYKNYSPVELIDIVARILALVPPWVRVYRIQRDIPMPLVSSGVEHGNLRELVLARMADLGIPCRDVRTREVGIQTIHFKVAPEQVELVRRDYVANHGWETFLAYEDAAKDILVALLRLRQAGPGAAKVRAEMKDERCSIVRELHVYGSVVPVHERDPGKFQHRGFGTLLMEEAERIARDEHGSTKMVVISGVGTRHYYRKLGYYLEGPYMVKRL